MFFLLYNLCKLRSELYHVIVLRIFLNFLSFFKIKLLNVFLSNFRVALRMAFDLIMIDGFMELSYRLKNLSPVFNLRKLNRLFILFFQLYMNRSSGEQIFILLLIFGNFLKMNSILLLSFIMYLLHPLLNRLFSLFFFLFFLLHFFILL